VTIGPGSRIGPYEVTALIGEGGMGRSGGHITLRSDGTMR